jgi:hypothetical protein
MSGKVLKVIFVGNTEEMARRCMPPVELCYDDDDNDDDNGDGIEFDVGQPVRASSYISNNLTNKMQQFHKFIT